MNFPKDLYYTKSHEWIKKLGEGTVQVGLSDHAQSELGDIVFVNLPAVGDAVKEGSPMGDVESVKAVSDVYSPVTGKVAKVNNVLADDPAKINTDCYAAWLVEVEVAALPSDRLSAQEYEDYLETL